MKEKQGKKKSNRIGSFPAVEPTHLVSTVRWQENMAGTQGDRSGQGGDDLGRALRCACTTPSNVERQRGCECLINDQSSFSILRSPTMTTTTREWLLLYLVHTNSYLVPVSYPPVPEVDR